MRNRFKGLDLIDRMPDELWTKVRDIVQETRIKTIPMEKQCKKAKWLSEEALQIAVKRREAKNRGEKESYSHLNAEFQRIARRDKKAFVSNQCKETEENNRMGKTRDLFKKIRDTKGTFHAKMSSIKDRNDMIICRYCLYIKTENLFTFPLITFFSLPWLMELVNKKKKTNNSFSFCQTIVSIEAVKNKELYLGS